MSTFTSHQKSGLHSSQTDGFRNLTAWSKPTSSVENSVMKAAARPLLVRELDDASRAGPRAHPGEIAQEVAGVGSFEEAVPPLFEDGFGLARFVEALFVAQQLEQAPCAVAIRGEAFHPQRHHRQVAEFGVVVPHLGEPTHGDGECEQPARAHAAFRRGGVGERSQTVLQARERLLGYTCRGSRQPNP